MTFVSHFSWEFGQFPAPGRVKTSGKVLIKNQEGISAFPGIFPDPCGRKFLVPLMEVKKRLLQGVPKSINLGISGIINLGNLGVLQGQEKVGEGHWEFWSFPGLRKGGRRTPGILEHSRVRKRWEKDSWSPGEFQGQEKNTWNSGAFQGEEKVREGH